MLNMKKIFIFFIWISITVFSVKVLALSRGLSVKIKNKPEKNAPVIEEVLLYQNSYALIIGIDNYANSWPKLTEAINDAEIVASELEKKGFEVTLKTDLNSDELSKTFKEFFIFKGENPQARLFVWFAGHGYSQDGEGYLIPSDAPAPEEGARFRYYALSMRRFGELVRQAKSKHVFVVFDSCFSGTIFSTQRSKPPPAVTRATTLPVRQFLSSGDAKQAVSDDGTFRMLFVRAITGEEPADANNDGYLSGSELGLFLTDRLTNLTESLQTPRYGKLRDPDYDQGDFIFFLRKADEAGQLKTTNKGYLSVESNIKRAKVLIDGDILGFSNLSFMELESGIHLLRLEKEGFVPYEKKIHIKKGQSLSQYVELKMQSKDTGRLFVNTLPVSANTKILNLDTEFHQGMNLKFGRYLVEISALGYETKNIWIVLNSTEDKTLNIHLKESKANKAQDSEGRFILLGNGAIKDSETNLEWIVGQDMDTTYKETELWIKGLIIDGGGWRFPTIKELRSLYQIGKGKCNMSSLFKVNIGWWVWSGGEFGQSAVNGFNFNNGQVESFNRLYSCEFRAFAVRRSKNTGNDNKGNKSVEAQKEDRFVALGEGVIKDTETDLEWISGTDRDAMWKSADLWIQSLSIDRGGWRFPTIKELRGLYQIGMGARNISPLFKINIGWWIWSGDEDGQTAVKGLNFKNGHVESFNRLYSCDFRVLAVRSSNHESKKINIQ